MIAGLEQKAHAYTVSKEGYEDAKGSVDLSSGDQEVAVQLEKTVVPPTTAAATFVVKDADDNPVAGATVAVDGKSGTTDADGKAVIAGLETGKAYGYTVHKDTYQDAQGNAMLPTEGLTVVVTLYQDGATLPTQYTVTFDAAGGRFTDGNGRRTVAVEAGQTVAKPDDPTREGYAFLAWQLDGQAYNFDSKVNADIELKAEWEVAPQAYLNVFVVDQDLKPIEDAKVMVPGFDEKKTDEYGLATFPVAADKDYNISVSAEGYNPASSGKVRVEENGLDFTFVLQKIEQNSGSPTPVESELLAGVEMYPNPASVATVLHGVENAKRIAVYTVMGVQVMSQAVHGEKELRVSVEHMAEGVYVVIVQTASGERKALKLVVRR